MLKTYSFLFYIYALEVKKYIVVCYWVFLPSFAFSDVICSLPSAMVGVLTPRKLAKTPRPPPRELVVAWTSAD